MGESEEQSDEKICVEKEVEEVVVMGDMEQKEEVVKVMVVLVLVGAITEVVGDRGEWYDVQLGFLE